MKTLLCPRYFLHYKSMKKIGAHGQATPKRIVLSGPKSNSSEILCLSLLSASLKKMRSKLKALSCPQHFFRRSRAGNSDVNRRMWPEFDLIRDSMTVLVTCKFDDDTAEYEGACVHNIFSIISLWGKISSSKGK